MDPSIPRMGPLVQLTPLSVILGGVLADINQKIGLGHAPRPCCLPLNQAWNSANALLPCVQQWNVTSGVAGGARKKFGETPYDFFVFCAAKWNPGFSRIEQCSRREETKFIFLPLPHIRLSGSIS